MENNYYLCLSENNYLKFDAVNLITNVFFDDYRQQIFIVKSASICVKSSNSQSFNFQLENFNNIIAIKFNQENNLLAVQRNENSLELIAFKNNQIVPNTSISYELKKTIIYGFIWTEASELIVISSDSVEIFQVNAGKRSMKTLKALPASSNWFCYHKSSFILLSSNNGNLLTPILIKPGSLTKLSPIQLEDGSVSERDVTTGMIYDKPAILILKTSRNRTLEVIVYLIEGPHFVKAHILKLGFTGRVAISIIDSLIIIHHQNNKISLIFDIALEGDIDTQQKSLMSHSAVLAGKSIKPFSIKLPSVSLKESTMNFELYSVNWVIFQNVIIDVKNGFLFKLELIIDKVLIGDKIKLVEFLMHRSNAKQHLLNVLAKTISPHDSLHLSILEIIFDKLNKIYKMKLDLELNKMQALPSPSTFKSFVTPPMIQPVDTPKQIVIEQSDMLQIFNGIIDKNILEKVLMVYIYSLVKSSITCEIDLSKMLVLTLVGSGKINDLQQVLSFQVLHESKMLACFLLSLANHDPLISQMAMDMLKRLNAHEIIVEILLEQGKIIDALRLMRLYANSDSISARKFLDAALKSDKMTFFSVYNYFVSRNQRLRGNNDFLKCK